MKYIYARLTQNKFLREHRYPKPLGLAVYKSYPYAPVSVVIPMWDHEINLHIDKTSVIQAERFHLPKHCWVTYP